MKKGTAVGAVLFLAAVCQVLAGGQPEGSADPMKKTTIRVGSLGWIITKFPVEDSARKYMEDHPNTLVEIISNQDASLNNYMLNWSTGDFDVDLAFGGSINQVAKLAYKNLLGPWNEFYRGEFGEDKFIPYVTEMAKKGDQYYAIPLMIEGMALEANKTMMIGAGLSNGGKASFPKSLEELYGFARKLTAGTGDIKEVYGFSWNFSVFGDAGFLGAVHAVGGKALNPDGSPNFSEPKVVDIFEFIKRVTLDGYGTKATITDANAGRMAYMAKKIAMIYESSARAIEAKPQLADDAIVLPWPGMESNGSYIYSHYAYITRDTKVREAIWSFMKEQVFSGYFASFGAEKFGKLPSLKRNYSGLGADFDDLREWINHPKTIGTMPWVEGSKLDSLLWELEQSVVTSDLTAQQAARQLLERGSKLDLSVVK